MSDDLFNLVVAGLGNPLRSIEQFREYRPSKAAMKHYEGTCRRTRQSLIGAQKFMVADSLLGHAVEASLCRPKTMREMCEIGVPPFDNMWIEWDDAKRIPLIYDAYRRRGVDTEPPKQDEWMRVGFHITVGGTKELEGVCHVDSYAMDRDTGKLYIQPFALQWAIEGDMPYESGRVVRAHLTSEQRGDEEHLMRAAQELRGHKILGEAWLDEFCDKTKDQAEVMGLMHKTLLVASQVGSAQVVDIIAEAGRSTEAEDYIGDMQDKSASGWRGDIRMIWAVLALVNYPQYIIERKYHTSVTKRIAWGRRVPRNELRMLEIDLPKPRGTTRYEKMFKGGGGKKRRHVRRGHWRHYRHKDGTVTKRWIAERWVGDASLGTITHDYILKSKGSKHE